MQLGEQLGADAGLTMEIISVLRNEELELVKPLELDEGQVGGIGLDLARRNPPLRSWEPSIAPRPNPVGAAEVGNTGVSADACTREGDNMLVLNDPASNGLDVLFEALFLSHDAYPHLRILRCSSFAIIFPQILFLVPLTLITGTRISALIFHERNAAFTVIQA